MKASDRQKYDFDKNGRLVIKFDNVNHIAHLSDALGILQEGKVRASLTSLPSCLTKPGPKVSWVSCNVWSQSIYGIVQFTFPWSQLLKNRDLFWVQAVEDEKNTRFQFLLRQRGARIPHGASGFDPTKDEGPLKKRGGTWYFNTDKRIGEFMLDADLPLTWCERIDFVPHRRDRCKYEHGTCQDMAMSDAEASARIAGCVIGKELEELYPKISPYGGPPKGRPRREMLKWANAGFGNAFSESKVKYIGTVSKGREARALFRKVALQFGKSNDEKARRLASKFKSCDALEDAMADIFERDFNHPRDG